MNTRKIIGLVLVVAGCAGLFLSNEISNKVAEGWGQIHKAQSQVNTIDSVFSSNKYTKGVGQQITGSAQQKINAGAAEARHYEGVASQVMILGVVLVIVGGVMFLIPSRKRK